VSSEALGAAYLTVGADTRPLAVGLRDAQRMTNSTMAQMSNSVGSFSKSFGNVMTGGTAIGAAIGGAALAVGTRNAIKYTDAMFRLSAAIGSVGGDYKTMTGAVEAFHNKLSKVHPIHEYETKAAAAVLIEQGRVSDPAKLTKWLNAAKGLVGLKGGGISLAEAAGDVAQFRLRGAESGVGAKYGMHFPVGVPPETLMPQFLKRAGKGAGMLEQRGEHPYIQAMVKLTDVTDKLGNAMLAGLPAIANAVGLLTQTGGIEDPKTGVRSKSPGIAAPGENLFIRATKDRVRGWSEWIDQQARGASNWLSDAAFGEGAGEDFTGSNKALGMGPWRPTRDMMGGKQVKQFSQWAWGQHIDALTAPTSEQRREREAEGFNFEKVSNAADDIETGITGATGPERQQAGGFPAMHPYVAQGNDRTQQTLEEIRDAIINGGGMQ